MLSDRLLNGYFMIKLMSAKVLLATAISLFFYQPAQAMAPPATPIAPSPTTLSGELLYRILVAELALRREHYELAIDMYLTLAQQTGLPEMAALATRAALAAKHPEQAVQAVQVWLALAPDALQAQRLAAYIYLGRSDPFQAVPYLQRMIALTSDAKTAYSQVAQLITRVQDKPQRLALMQAVLEETPTATAPEALLALAGLAYESGLSEQALTSLRSLITMRPDWVQAWRLTVRILIQQGQLAEARQTLHDYFAQGREDVELRLLHARLLLENHDFAGARQVFDALLQQDALQADILLAAGSLSLQLGELTIARDYLQRLYADQSNSHHQQAALLLGQLEEQAHRFEQALQWYQRVNGDKQLDAQAHIATLYIQQGYLDAAQSLFQHLRTQLPEQQITLYLLEGESLYEAQYRDQALALYTEALAAFPDSEDLLYARGLLAARMQQVPLLEQDLRHLLTLNPDHSDALNALGYTLADQTDRFNEAYRLIKRAWLLDSEEPAILDSMGWVLYRMGHLTAAEWYLQQALTQMPDGEIAAHLGEVLWVLGQQDQARTVWTNALQDDPEHDYLLQTIRRYMEPADLNVEQPVTTEKPLHVQER
jgi:Flp pilus assembly protein TadD